MVGNLPHIMCVLCSFFGFDFQGVLHDLIHYLSCLCLFHTGKNNLLNK